MRYLFLGMGLGLAIVFLLASLVAGFRTFSPIFKDETVERCK